MKIKKYLSGKLSSMFAYGIKVKIFWRIFAHISIVEHML
nr:MAG TPA: hypothetical protein [Bacteriophage sp.]